MELSANARTVLERRYLKKEEGKPVETPEDMLRRVAEKRSPLRRNTGNLPRKRRSGGGVFPGNGREKVLAELAHFDECRP